MRSPSTWWLTGATCGVARTVSARAARARTETTSSDGATREAAASTSRDTNRTIPAPVKAPMLQNAWNRLIIGPPRARSTWTATAFIATSIVPFPRPSRAPPATATARLGASAMTRVPADISGIDASATPRAPRRSASRPPTCIDSTAAVPTPTSRTDRAAASMPSRSRSAGRTPP